MSHEIYYTSAPEGIRHGQQGFCTVATSAGIPKPLWDRLESVSGYRHPFGAAPGRSPVTWAHWLIDAGREVSVLSRICDSGLDYTQRTNAFAHHLALEPDERAAAGPAWMLRQDGVMSRQWDGRVGTIARPVPLPRGDSAPAPCATWQRMTGDAGWAGALAETVARKPRKTAFILFNAGQDLLPLIAEAIALLPAPLRWQATFNTYFTSAPGNATCLWRCCLANSPAAQEALRRSSGSLVLDLTNPAQLGAPPAGPWVDAARAGRIAQGPSAPAVTIVKPTAKPMAPSRPPALIPFAVQAAPPPPLPAFRSHAARGNATALAPRLDLVEMTPSDGSASGAEVNWTGPSRMPRRAWVIGLSGAALAFVAVGTWLRLNADRDASSRNAPLGQVTTAAVAPGDIPAPVWPPSTTNPTDHAATSSTGGVPDVIPVPPVPAPPTTHAVVTPVVVATVPSTPTPPAVTMPTPPPTPAVPAVVDMTPLSVVLGDPVQTPVAGAGIRDPVQALVLPADVLTSVGGIQVLLPGRQSSYTINGDDVSGTLSAAVDPNRPLRVTLVWHDAGNPGLAIDVGSVWLDPPRRPVLLQVSWKTSTLLKRAAVSLLARAVLQNAVIVVNDAHGGRQREISFKTPEPTQMEIGQPKSALAVGPIPASVTPRIDAGAPAGWDLTAEREWEAGARHVAELSGWVLHFRGPAISDHANCEFELHVAPGWASVQSNWAAQREGLVASVSASADDLKRIADEADQQRASARIILVPFFKELEDSKAALRLPDAELASRFTTRPEARRRLESAQSALQDRRNRLDQDLAGILARRADAERAHTALAADVKAFDDMNNVDIVAELPGGVRAAVFRLVRQAAR